MREVVAVAFKRPFSENALPSTRLRTRRRIGSRFGIDADELLFQHIKLIVRYLDGFYGAK
jgi:hypothetical protein